MSPTLPASHLPDLVLLGPPGSGKGTQAAYLHDHFGYQIMAIGDFLRSRANQSDQLGSRLNDQLASGEFVDDDLVETTLSERLIEVDPARSIVYDGFPRRAKQLAALDRLTAARLPLPTEIIILKLPDAKAVSRLEDRMICAHCGHIGRKSEEICRVCGGSMVARTDDRRAVHEKRLALYRSEEEALVSRLQLHYPVHWVEADQAPEAIFAEVTRVLEERKKERHEPTA